MMRIALVVVWGGVMFAAGEAGACEAHAAKARATAPVSADSRREDATTDAAAGKKDGVGEPHAAKCQCSSAADCTCKKGSCECSRCKPRREAVPAEAEAAAMREARQDPGAGAGV